MVKKRCTFKNLEENMKNPKEVIKTRKKFKKLGKNFQKTFHHPDNMVRYGLQDDKAQL